MKQLEADIYNHLKERNWHNLRPSDLAKSIMIEGAELLELFQWENRALEEVRGDQEKVEAIKKELADVLLYCIEMSVLLELDTEMIMRDKLAYVQKKYPAELMRNTQQEPGTEDEYWRIKREYRKQGL